MPRKKKRHSTHVRVKGYLRKKPRHHKRKRK